MISRRLATIPALLAAAATMAFAAGSANAAVLITVSEVAGDVVFTANGSLDLTGASFSRSNGYDDGFISQGSNWYVAMGAGNVVELYVLTSFDGEFGSNSSFISSPDSVSGSDFVIWGQAGIEALVGVPVGYSSGQAISSQMIFGNATIAGFGMIPGIYNYGIPNDTITLAIGTVVPVPAAVWLLGSGLLGLVGIARRRRA